MSSAVLVVTFMLHGSASLQLVVVLLSFNNIASEGTGGVGVGEAGDDKETTGSFRLSGLVDLAKLVTHRSCTTRSAWRKRVPRFPIVAILQEEETMVMGSVRFAPKWYCL